MPPCPPSSVTREGATTTSTAQVTAPHPTATAYAAPTTRPAAPGSPRALSRATWVVVAVARKMASQTTTESAAAAICRLPPVLPELQDRLHWAAAAVAVFAATPVICCGVGSGFAAALARRDGEARVVFGAMIALTAGLIARGGAPAVLLFPGTILP